MGIQLSSRMKKVLWFGVSTAIILGMIYFADVQRFMAAIQRADIRYLVPAFSLGLSVFLVWTYTWYSFFKDMGMKISYSKSFRLFMAGNFFNSVTPLGQFGGEPFMAYIISKNTDYSAERGFSAVLSADIVNSAPTLTFIIGGALFQFLFGNTIRDEVLTVFYIVLLAAVGGALIVYLLWFKSGSIENALIRVLRRTTSAIGKGESMVTSLEERLKRVQDAFSEIGDNPVELLKTALVAHLGFLSQVVCLAFILLSLGFSFNFVPLYFTLTLSALANFSPTPGGSGTFEAAMAGLLALFLNITFAQALVAAILFRMTTYWPGILIGYISFNTLENGVKK